MTLYPSHDESDKWHRPDKPGGRYWRITFYNQETEFVQADILEVNRKNGLVFKRMYEYDVALNKKKYIVSHSINRELWSGVTECSKTGVPLWTFDYAGPVYGEDPEEELPPHPDASDEELEILGMYVEHVMKQVAESAIEKATINSATRKSENQ